MSKEAVNLTKALKGDNKTQGNWGELVLERTLGEQWLLNGQPVSRLYDSIRLYPGENKVTIKR